jgi:phenylpropionate dioxygenase-like ring-hydroxylating dioxygenase large terminal subunit
MDGVHAYEYNALGRMTVIPVSGRNIPVPEVFRIQGYPTCEAHGFIHSTIGHSVGKLAAFLDGTETGQLMGVTVGCLPGQM